MTWRHIGVFVMPIVDMRFVVKGRIGNTNAPPPHRTTMQPAAFLELLDRDAPPENEPDPAA